MVTTFTFPKLADFKMDIYVENWILKNLHVCDLFLAVVKVRKKDILLQRKKLFSTFSFFFLLINIISIKISVDNYWTTKNIFQLMY